MSIKKKRMCIICQKNEVFSNKFDKCLDCAGTHRGQMHEKFVACLSSEQLALFEVYSKASEDFTSMIILD